MPPPLGPPKERTANVLHRFTGAIGSVVLLYLMLTGVPLQFTDGLKLGDSHVQASWVLDAYGITAPNRATASGSVALIGDALLLGDTQDVDTTARKLIGAVDFGTHLIVATDIGLSYVDPRPPVALEALPAPITPTAIGRAEDNALLISNGETTHRTSDLMTWTQVDAVESFAEVRALEGDALQSAQGRYRGRLITWERWLQDLHSGRFFGPVGEWIVTLGSLLIIVLACTGFIMWYRQRKMKKLLASR